MEKIVECLIAGGPQHGVTRRQLWDTQYPTPPVIASADGAVCLAAACRHASADSNRFLLLHPRATGAQILAMVNRLNTDAAQHVYDFDAEYALPDSG